MDYSKENQNWDSFSYVEKNISCILSRRLFWISFWRKVQSLRHSMIIFGVMKDLS